MMSKLSSVDELSSPPLSSSSRSRHKSRDVSRGHRDSCRCLSLADMMSKLSPMDELSSPPLSSSSRSRHKSRDVSRGHGDSSRCLSFSSLSNGHMMDITVWEIGTWETLCSSSMIDITKWVVGTWKFRRGLHWGLGSSCWSLDEGCLVDPIIFSQKGIVTVWVGRAEGL